MRMPNILAIDPGVRHCAVAWEFDGALRWVDFDRLPADGPPYRSVRAHWGETGPIDVLVIERPVIYPHGRAKPADLMALTRAGYLLAGRANAAEIVEYEPRQWKGQLPKPVTHLALWDVLTQAERDCFAADTETRIREAADKGSRDHWRRDGASYYGRAAGSSVHNLLDAAALLCVHTRRLKLV